MKIVKEIDDIRREVEAFSDTSVALVPTMGSLHEGHVELIKTACKRCEKVIVSIFVNPAQFDDIDDLRDYPRSLDEDLALVKDMDVDIVFTPKADDLFKKDSSTWVAVDGLSDHLCGKNRPGHFRGVATVVAKLFNITRPDIAFFGEKDWQQQLIIKKMVKDLDFPIEIVSVPTVREPNGLAISSRNSNLSDEERSNAHVIWKSMIAARDDICNGQRDVKSLKAAISDIIESRENFSLEYISLCRPDDLSELESAEPPLLIAIAVRAGNTRLIDNLLVS